MRDPRITELEELARDEGLTLPLPIDLIVFFEKRGRIVDLTSGRVTHATVGLPTPSGKAVSHLLRNAIGPVSL